MRALARLLLAVLVAAAGIPFPAQAHTRSETQSVWRVAGSAVHLTFTIPDVEARRLTKDQSQPSDAVLSKYIADNVGVLDGDKACPRVGNIQTVQASTGFRRYDFRFQCPDDKDIALHSSAFFALVPTHITYAQIVTESGDFVEQLFNEDQQTLELSTASGKSPLQDASFFEYIGMGIMHIFTGYDHQAFILALILLSTRLRDLIFVITGFTIGHSVSLSLAVLGVIRPHAEYIDSLVGLTIALVAAENIAHASGRTTTIALGFGMLLLLFTLAHPVGFGGLPIYIVIGAAIFAFSYMEMSGHLRDAARLRLIVTLIFGTIHGFSFAANLLEMRLPAGRLAQLLVGFNVGVEIGQLAVVGVLLGGLALLRRMKLTLPRPIVVDGLSAALFAVGLYWFFSRGYALAV